MTGLSLNTYLQVGDERDTLFLFGNGPGPCRDVSRQCVFHLWSQHAPCTPEQLRDGPSGWRCVFSHVACLNACPTILDGAQPRKGGAAGRPRALLKSSLGCRPNSAWGQGAPHPRSGSEGAYSRGLGGTPPTSSP